MGVHRPQPSACLSPKAHPVPTRRTDCLAMEGLYAGEIANLPNEPNFARQVRRRPNGDFITMTCATENREFQKRSQFCAHASQPGTRNAAMKRSPLRLSQNETRDDRRCWPPQV